MSTEMIPPTHQRHDKNIGTLELSALEFILLQKFVAGVNSCAIKARYSLDADSFYVIFYDYPLSKKRPAIKRPISEWDLYKASDVVLIGPHPYGGYYSSQYPYSHMNEDVFYLATREELTVFFRGEIA